MPLTRDGVDVDVDGISIHTVSVGDVAGNTEEALAVVRDSISNLHALQVFPGAGHWLQQELPGGVNGARSWTSSPRYDWVIASIAR